MDFNNLVRSIVEPVLLFFGFKIKQELKGIAEYDLNNLAITISYDLMSSYEVDVTLLFKESGLFYGYSELKEYFYNIEPHLSAVQIKDENTLIEWLQDVKEFLKENLNEIIDDQKDVQKGLERIRQNMINSYESKKNSRLLSESVEKYWAVKDYQGLVKFLKSYNGELGRAIKKKYEYALKMIDEKKNL